MKKSIKFTAGLAAMIALILSGCSPKSTEAPSDEAAEREETSTTNVAPEKKKRFPVKKRQALPWI